ncbi:MAG: hypothetical protein DMF91_27765 [Acidobacteria bacterium]|nr:MAG: hypothetical protein DMF91_27765 [Acidobacteriota bacterium]
MVRRFVAILGVFFVFIPAALHAQAVKGALLGNITDQGGLAVPGASVTITETSTNISYSTTTNESGYYIFPSLKDGTYKVVTELSGFKKAIRDGVIVPVNTTIRVDLRMEVGALEESITVVGESPMLQTDRTDTGRIIESKMVTDLPLTFNRNFQSILVTVPGATRPHREHSAFFNSQDSLSTEVNGQSRLANNTMIEGLDDNHKTGLLQVIIPAADALETVSVTTSNYDAEFGRSGGAITNVTLKSGTNTLKGSVFFFGNNEKTNASDYFTHLKAPTKFANAGFTLGGPIVKSKFFFFGDYQRTLDNSGYVVRTTVPTAAMRAGDFSAVAQHIYDPLTGDIGGNGRVAFANNQIPLNRISPIALKLLAFVPLPNISAPLGQNNFQQAQTREKTTDGFDTKLNFTPNAKDQMSYRVSFMRPVVFDPGAFGQYGGPANGGFAGTGTNNSVSTGVTWTRVISASTLLDVRGGLNYYHNTTVTTGDGLTTSTDIGIPGANLDQYTSGISQIGIGGYGDPLLGFSASQPWDRSEKTWNVVSSVTRLMQTHTVKIGGEFRKNTDVLLQTQDAGGPRGRFGFGAAGTGSPAESASLSGLANPFAAFLLDWPDTVQRDLKVIDQPGTRHWAMATFIQDKWQVRPQITVDRTPLGVLQAARGHRGQGDAGQLRSVDQYDSGCRVWQHDEFGQRPELLQELRSAHRPVVAAQRPYGRPGWLRRERDSVPGQPLCVHVPGEAELLRHQGEQLPAGGNDGGRFPGACAGEYPERRHHPRDGLVAQFDLRRHPARSARGHAAFMERRLPAPIAVRAGRRHRVRGQRRRRSRHGRRPQREPRVRVW